MLRLRDASCENQSQRQRQKFRFVPNLEWLENRLVPTATARVNNFGDLIVTSDGASDTIAISRTGPGTFDVVINSDTTSVSGVKRDIRATLKGGADSLTLTSISAGIRDVIIDAGNDSDFTQITDSAIFRNLVFKGGTGNSDECYLDSVTMGGSLSFDGGAGNADQLQLDNVTMSGSLSFNGGKGNGDLLTMVSFGSVKIGAHLSFNGGGGTNDDFSLSSAIVTGNVNVGRVNVASISQSTIGGSLKVSGGHIEIHSSTVHRTQTFNGVAFNQSFSGFVFNRQNG